MKKTFLLVVFTAIISSIACSQIQYEPISTIRKGIFNRKVYTRCDIELEPIQLIKLFSKDPNMHHVVPAMSIYYISSQLLTTAASVLILWPVTEAILDNNNPNWKLAYIGAGCAALAIPFTIIFNKKSAKAVKYYNARYRDVKLDLQVSPIGIGMVLKF